MSKYTTELRFICETEAGLSDSVGYNGVANVISKARPKIFSFTYPIFDDAYKPTLETKILRHFYTREIGLETYGLWKLKLEAKMNEIMPYYNQLYKSELIEFNPLYDTDINTSGHRDDIVKDTGTVKKNETGNSTGKSKNSGSDTRKDADKNNTWDLFSDTPQGGVRGIQGAEDDPAIGTNAFLTNARHIIGDTSGSTGSTTYGRVTDNTGTNTVNGTTTTDMKKDGDVDYVEHVYGFRGKSPSKSLQEFRETMLNIDMKVIKDLEDLFFQLW